MKQLLAILLALSVATPAFAMTTPIFIEDSISNLNTIVTTRDFPLTSNGGVGGNNGIVTQTPMPTAGTVGNLNVALPAALTNGSYVFTIFKAGVATALTCTIGAGQSTCSDTSHTVSYAQGDLASVRISLSGTPDTITTSYMSVTFDGTTDGESLLAGATPLQSTATVIYSPPNFQVGAVSAVEINRSQVFPTNGTFDDLFVKVSGAPGAGNSWLFAVRQNGATTTLTCTVSNTNTTCNDTTPGDAVTLAPGDLVDVVVLGAGTPAVSKNGAYSVRFKPTTNGESVIMTSTGGTNQTTSADRFFYPGGGSAGNQGVEASTSAIAPTNFTWKSEYVNFDSAPGAGKSRAQISRVGAIGSIADGALSCTVSNTNTTCNDTTNSVSVTTGQAFDWDTRPTATPGSSPNIRVGAVVFIAPPAASTVIPRYFLNMGFWSFLGGKILFL